MDSNLLDMTYTTPLVLQYEDLSFVAGFCLSGLGLESLKDKRNSFLHPKEQVHFEALKYPKRQHSYLLGRYCAKQALNTHMNKKDPTNILIENGVFQQPIVYSLTHMNQQVSISHTNTLGAALAFHEAYPMAIDIESINKDKDDTISTQLSNNELNLAASLPNAPPLSLLWTIKEALSKVLKCGLTIPFELLEIEALTQQGACIISHFTNFPQYQAISFFLSEATCSIVYPKKATLNMDILSIQEKVFNFTRLTMP